MTANKKKTADKDEVFPPAERAVLDDASWGPRAMVDDASTDGRSPLPAPEPDKDEE